MPEKRFDVACCGLSVTDVFGKPIDTIPDKGKLAVFDQLEMHTGGCALNVANALGKMGLSAAVLSKTGDDVYRDFIIKDLHSNNVDTSALIKDANVSTSFTFVMVPSDGQRRFIHNPAANRTFCYDDVDFDVIADSKILHIGGTFLMETFDGEQTAKVLEKARSMGVITVLDTAYSDSVPDPKALMQPCYPHLDFFLPSVEEAEMLSGMEDPKEMAKYFKDQGCDVVGIKMGDQGSIVLSDSECFEVPIFKVDVVDTSGAGDAFVSGFLAGVSKGWELKRCARFGNAVASFCVQAIGTTTGIRSFDEMQKFQQERDS
jgi:sugar/nucleoside kinase (ribokinase family)